MQRTYELYVAQKHEPPRFVAVPGDSIRDIMSKARVILAEEDADSIEVREQGQLLFTLMGRA